MKIPARLPKFLQPKKTNNSLTRLGRDYDGGYLIDKRNIKNTDLLIGLGINDDWSFEENFYSIKKIPIYSVDGSVGEKIFFKKFVRSLFRFHSPTITYKHLKKYLKFKQFFKKDRYHLKKFVGIDKSNNFVSLPSLMKEITFSKESRIFFKIDIEKWEYQILGDLIKYSDLIEGTVIEFHDLDTHLESIQKFIEAFPLNLCHVHCNNYSPINKDKLPLSIECTFTNLSVDDAYEFVFPNKLDMPNKKDIADYVLTFEW